MLIYAHRGASGEFAEGSKIAYEEGIKQGADGFECDVRLSKDAQIICYHDRNTKRLSGINLEIAKNDFTTLSKNIELLKLEQLLELAISHKKDLVIESKHPVPSGRLVEKLTHQLLDQYAKSITQSGINIYLISFSLLATYANIKSGYQSGYLIQNQMLARFNPAPIIGVSINIIRANPNFVANAHKKGKKVFVFTVNEAADLLLCSKLGVQAVMSDYPKRARLILGYS